MEGLRWIYLVNQFLVNQMSAYLGGVMKEHTLDLFQKIEMHHPSDMIIQQIQDRISQGVLKPGTKLPSERELSQQFHVGRGYVRQALKKLEFYGIVQTLPKQGTVIASLGVKALEGLIANILHLDKKDYHSLLETRTILEMHSAELAARHAGAEEKAALQQRHQDFRHRIEEGNRGLEEDHLFHLCIAESSRNSVLTSLIGLITPDIIMMNRDAGDMLSSRRDTFAEHQEILDGIVSGDQRKARSAMRFHMEQSIERRFADQKKS